MTNSDKRHATWQVETALHKARRGVVFYENPQCHSEESYNAWLVELDLCTTAAKAADIIEVLCADKVHTNEQHNALMKRAHAIRNIWLERDAYEARLKRRDEHNDKRALLGLPCRD